MNAAIPLSSPDITQAEIDAVVDVLHSGRLCLGPELESFETALAQYHSAADAVALSSGTAGLHLALIALGVGQGDEVIVPSFTFIAVANAVAHVGAKPVFVDIDPVTLNIAPDAVERAITPRTRALIVVHTFGVPAEIDRLAELARQHSLFLIEDASEALGAEFDGRRVGCFGDLGVLGFYPNKQMTTAEGGALLSGCGTHAARLRSLRNQGRDAGLDWLDTAEIGYNYRISEMSCALGRVQLNRVGEMLAMRRAAAQFYDSILGGIPGLERPPLTLPGRTISWFVYVVRLPSGRDTRHIQAKLSSQGIASSRYFGPIHLQPAWLKYLGGESLLLPVTEEVASRTLAIPFFTRITTDQQERVAAALARALE